MKTHGRLLLSGLVLLAALAVRLPPLAAGLPYMAYVDEGHVLHHAAYLLAHRTWEPDTYSYPTLPFYLVAGAALAASPPYRLVHGRSLLDDLGPAPPVYYDLVAPAALILLGRCVTLAFSLGIVVLTGLLARRLAGPAAGLLAAWLAALVPALVWRSSIVNVNPLAAFFSLAALVSAEAARSGGRPRRHALLAGALAGLAGATKYPAALVCLPVALAVLLADASWGERLRRLLLAGGAAVLALLLAMPALALRTGDVLRGMRDMDSVYGSQEIGSYWSQAVRRAEWDLPAADPELGAVFLLLAAAGAVLALRDRRWAAPAAGWLLFAAATGALVAPYQFRAFRNLLALVPLACAAAALLYARLRERLPRRGWLDVAAALLPAALFAPALHAYDTAQLAVQDSREQACHWLAGHTGPADRILVLRELAFLPSRLDALPARVLVRSWDKARDRVIERRDPYLVLGEVVRPDGRPRIPPPLRRWILANYQVAARFGTAVTYPSPHLFRGNDQTIYVLRRKGGRPAGASPGPEGENPPAAPSTPEPAARGAGSTEPRVSTPGGEEPPGLGPGVDTPGWANPARGAAGGLRPPPRDSRPPAARAPRRGAARRPSVP